MSFSTTLAHFKLELKSCKSEICVALLTITFVGEILSFWHDLLEIFWKFPWGFFSICSWSWAFFATQVGPWRYRDHQHQLELAAGLWSIRMRRTGKQLRQGKAHFRTHISQAGSPTPNESRGGWNWVRFTRAYFSAFWQKLNLLKMSKLNLKTQKLNLKTRKLNLKMLKLNGEMEKLLYMANLTPVRSLNGLT